MMLSTTLKLLHLCSATVGMLAGFLAMALPKGSGLHGAAGSKDGYSVAFYAIFGSIALLFAAFDLRMLVRGGVFGAKRIARHLWRMSMALLFASFSFYPGQGRHFAKWLHDTNVLYVPHVLLIGAMLLWLYRVSVLKRVPHNRVRSASHGDAIVGRVVGAGGSV